jgi:hypothetical protein
VEARNEAAEELTSLKKRIPRVELRIRNAPIGAVVAIDDTVVDNAQLAGSIMIDPGKHTATLTVADVKKVEERFTAEVGATRHVVLALPDDTPGKGSLVPGFAVLGVGAAGLIAGGVTGAIAFTKTNAIKTHCIGIQCPTQYEADGDEANAFATASTATFIIGGVVAATGVVLLVVRPGDAAAPRASVALVAGPGSIGLKGTF